MSQMFNSVTFLGFQTSHCSFLLLESEHITSPSIKPQQYSAGRLPGPQELGLCRPGQCCVHLQSGGAFCAAGISCLLEEGQCFLRMSPRGSEAKCVPAGACTQFRKVCLECWHFLEGAQTSLQKEGVHLHFGALKRACFH